MLGKRSEKQQDQHQYDCMDNTGNRCTASVVDIGHRTGNCSGNGNTSEDGNNDIGSSLGDQFRVRIMFISRHTVGYSC